ncbi:cupin domain-containing protein [Microdochium nivale]|nr:cupin domain-containing protein [Microdochium nivale]
MSLHNDSVALAASSTIPDDLLGTGHTRQFQPVRDPPITGLPPTRRFITTHDESGYATYSEALPELIPLWPVGPRAEPAAFGLAYTTNSTPVLLTRDSDLEEFQRRDRDRQNSGLVQHGGGSVVRYVDYPPRACSPMHRTVSCDYAIAVFGQMSCLLDSGESRTLNPGDILIQRGTMHQWINQSDTWARMLYVLLDAAPVKLCDKTLGEELGGMEGVASSA